MIYEDPVTNIDIDKHTLQTQSGKSLKYGSLIIATGCTATRYFIYELNYSMYTSGCMQSIFHNSDKNEYMTASITHI